MSLFTQFFSFIAPEKASGKQDKRDIFVLIGSSRYERQIISAAHAQRVLEELFGSHVPPGVHCFATAWLIPEEKNPRAKNAVRVVIRGKAVGYLQPGDASLFRQQRAERGMPDAIGQCQAVIKGGWVSSDGRKGPVEVWLDLPSAYL